MIVTSFVVQPARRTAELLDYPGEFHVFGTPAYKKDLYDRYLAWIGRYVISMFVQYAPYEINWGPETWPEKWEAFGDTVVDTLAEYCPGLKESILFRQVLTPWDMEQDFALTQGNIFQGELSLEQLLFQRPAAGVPAYMWWRRHPTPDSEAKS